MTLGVSPRGPAKSLFPCSERQECTPDSVCRCVSNSTYPAVCPGRPLGGPMGYSAKVTHIWHPCGLRTKILSTSGRPIGAPLLTLLVPGKPALTQFSQQDGFNKVWSNLATLDPASDQADFYNFVMAKSCLQSHVWHRLTDFCFSCCWPFSVDFSILMGKHLSFNLAISHKDVGS